MTCAGIAVADHRLGRLNRGDAEVVGRPRAAAAANSRPTTPSTTALAWLARNFSVHNNPGDRGSQIWLLYYLYGLERVGRMTTQRFIGQHDWYREGADMLVPSRTACPASGTATGMAEDDPHDRHQPGAAVPGQRPAAGPGGQAQARPERRLESSSQRPGQPDRLRRESWQRDLTWQVIDIRAGHASKTDCKRRCCSSAAARRRSSLTSRSSSLREYVDRGGFIFAEACCGGGELRQRLSQADGARSSPSPSIKLHLLPPEHPIWRAEEPVDPQLRAAAVGHRRRLPHERGYCPKNLVVLLGTGPAGPRRSDSPAGCRPKINAARSVGINVLAYATNRELKYKLEIPHARPTTASRRQFDRGKLYVAKLRHPRRLQHGSRRAAESAAASPRDKLELRVSTEPRECG